MDQIEANKKDILKTIREYGEMEELDQRAVEFLANCWAAYNALCLVCEDRGSMPTQHSAVSPAK